MTFPTALTILLTAIVCAAYLYGRYHRLADNHTIWHAGYQAGQACRFDAELDAAQRVWLTAVPYDWEDA